MRPFEIYIDGAAKGNPGPAGIGVVVTKSGKTLKDISHYIGEATNNVAEYTALIYGLQEALIQKTKNVKVYTDSELLYKQVKKLYKIKNTSLKVLMLQVQHLISGFEGFDIDHIPREKNKEADRLASKAVENFAKQETFNF